jgi:hypothetical protein
MITDKLASYGAAKKSVDAQRGASTAPEFEQPSRKS